MIIEASSSSSNPSLKRRRLVNFDPMETEQAKAKLTAAKEKFGREIRVFETAPPSPSSQNVDSGNEEMDELYDFTSEDYYRMLNTKKEDKFLKTRKIRDAEQAARRARITKAVIRVRFPDNTTLEATFHPSETLQNLIDLLKRVVARPELPFHIYTTPPKKLVKDLTQDFYSAGFAPGAIVYFSYDDQDFKFGPFLHEEIMSLEGLELKKERAEPVQTAPEPVQKTPAPVIQEKKPADRKSVKPKWLRM